MTKHPIALRLGQQECKNYLLLYSSFTFILECSVFPIQSSDVCFKMRLIRKTTCETLRGANTTGAVRAFSVTQASAQSSVEWDVRLVYNVLLEPKSFFNVFSFKSVYEFESLYKLYKTNNECFLIRAMEQIFSFGER